MLRCIKTSSLNARIRWASRDLYSLPIAFTLYEEFYLFEVSSFPVAQVRFLDHDARVDSPTQFRLVRKAHADKEQTSFLEGVLRPIDYLPVDARILVARCNFPHRLLRR